MLVVPNAAFAITEYRQGLGRRTETTTDYGPANNNAAIIVYIDLKVVSPVVFINNSVLYLTG